MFVTLLVSRHTSTSEFRRTPDEKDVEGEGKGERFRKGLVGVATDRLQQWVVTDGLQL